MGLVTQVTGSSWVTSGSATTGTTGLDTLTGTWTHVGSSDVPAGSGASGYIQMAAGAGGTLRIDDATTPFGSNDDYWIRLWVYAERDGALAADGTSWFPHSMSDTGTRLRTQGYLRNEVLNPGFTMSVFEFLTGGTKLSLSNVGASGGPSVIPFDAWFELAIHIRRDTVDGRYGLYINGVLVSEISGIDTDGGIESDDLASDWIVNLTAIAGVRWRVAGPIESWDGVDISVRPRHELVPANSYLTQHLLQHWDDTVYSQGRFFTIGGTATVAASKYSTSGISPHRRRLVCSGSSGATVDVGSIDGLGLLPFNRLGWATVMLTDFYLPGSPGDFQFTLRDAGDTSDVVSLSVVGGQLKQGGVVLGSVDGGTRYALAVHLRDTGQAGWSLIDLTNGFNSVQTFFSGALSGWTPQAVGKVKLTATLGSVDIEIGAVDVCSWWEAVGVDSLSHAEANGVTPALATVNHVAGQFAANRDYEMVPGGAFTLRDQWAVKGFGRRSFAVVLGRSGMKRSDFTPNVVGGVSGARGMILWNVDGGSINDVGSGTADDAARDSKVSAMVADVGGMINALVVHGNGVVLSTMIRREQGTYNGRDLEEIDLFNSGVLGLGFANQRDGLIQVADVAASINPHAGLFTAGDDVHFDAAGDEEVAIEMVERMTTPGEVLFTDVDRSRLDAVFGKLPSAGFLRGTGRSDGAAEDVDGVGDGSFREALLAYIAGESVVVDNGDGTKTITYRKQDGATAKLAITFNTTGEFTGTQID